LLIAALAGLLGSEGAVAIGGALQHLRIDPIRRLVLATPLMNIGQPNTGHRDLSRVVTGVPQAQPARHQRAFQISEQAEQYALLTVEPAQLCPLMRRSRVDDIPHGFEDLSERQGILDDLPQGDGVGVQPEVVESGIRSHRGSLGRCTLPERLNLVVVVTRDEERSNEERVCRLVGVLGWRFPRGFGASLFVT